MEIISNTALISINETLIIQVLSFLIFLFIINRLMFRPLHKTIGDRERHFEDISREIDKTKKDVEKYSAEIEKTIEEIVIMGDWAFERGNEVSKITTRSSGDVKVVHGKYINIFQKQWDGSWKIARRIRNLNHKPSK